MRELQVRSDTPDLYELHIPSFNAFRTLHGLNKFTFICGARNSDGDESSMDSDGPIGWEHYARTVQANLLFLFSLPSLRTLEIGGIQNLPSSLLVSFLRLEHLILDAHVSVDPSMYASSPTSLMVLSSIRLKSLTLRQVGVGLISALASMLAYKPNGLKRLDLAPVRLVDVEEVSGAVWSLLRLGARSLEEFEWEGLAARPQAFKPIHLGSIRTTLRHLTVSITYSAWFAEPQVLSDLHALLRHLSSSDSVLEVVTIKTCFAGGSSGEGGTSSADYAGGFDLHSDPEFLDEWSELDKILCQKRMFKKLDRVELEYVRHSAVKKNVTAASLGTQNSRSFATRSTVPPPSLAEMAYAHELDWWTETACVFAERLAGTRAKGVVIAFGESKVQRRSWAVFEPRSPMSPVEEVRGVHGAFEWRPMVVEY